MITFSRLLQLSPEHMQGPDVLEIQQRLSQRAYEIGKIDGIFGPKTEDAVKQFQRERHLIADGIVGPNTWREILSGQPFIYPRIVIGNNRENAPDIQIDLNKKNLALTSSQLTKTYPIAIGKPSTPTPTGTWQVVQKVLNPGGPFGTRWMRLSIQWGGYGIHGTNNPDSIGMAVSHGCIRMYNKDVEEVYHLVPIGTPVSITGEVLKRTLLSGSRGADVKLLQTMFIELGFLSGPADGIFGPAANQAVIAFQKNYNLKPDGIAGPKTLKVIQYQYALKEDNPQP